MRSDLVTGSHLCRRAVIYIRQSTPHQVMTNQESLRLQYALRQRAIDLGWDDTNIDVVDADLGLSGSTAAHREGFKDVIARVTLGEIGIVLSYEVTRSRATALIGTRYSICAATGNASLRIATASTILAQPMGACYSA